MATFSKCEGLVDQYEQISLAFNIYFFQFAPTNIEKFQVIVILIVFLLKVVETLQ